MSRVVQVVLAVVAVVVVGAGVWMLRGATMSTHEPVEPGSRLAIIAEVHEHRAERGHTLTEMLAAKIAVCRLEVRDADPVGEPQPLDEEDTFQVVLEPSIDETDQTQLRGCLEDWNVDHVQIDVLDMVEVAGA